MITGEIKSKVDRIWDTLWSGGISNPLTIIEQLTYLLFIKTNSGGTDHVWFYDMQADGFSLDDKRSPQPDKSDLPDILRRWKTLKTESSEKSRARTDQSFLVPKAEIVANGYDLSLNRYKEVVHETVDHDSPKKILTRLAKLEDEITKGRKELEGLLK